MTNTYRKQYTKRGFLIKYKCVACGKKKPHYAKGMCSACYERTRRAYKRDYFREHYSKLYAENYPIKEIVKECCG